MNGRRRARAIGIGMMVLACGIYSESPAAEWSAEPSLGVKGEYNSNLILTAAPHESTYGHWVSPGVTFAGSIENFDVSGKAALDFVRYYGGVETELTNVSFPLSAHYRLDKEMLAFDGRFTRDNTLRGELLQTGLVLGFTQRNLWNLAPSWTHAFTEQLSLQSGYSYSNATYENGARLGLVDYDLHSGSMALSYRWTERDQVKVIGNYTSFSVPTANALRSNIAGAQLSFSHAFSESITASLAGGPQIVSSVIKAGPFRITDTQTVWVAHANLRKQWDDAHAEVVVSREILPSGFGLLLQTERVGLTLSKTLTERLTASVNGQVFLATSAASETAPITLPENRYVTVTPQLTWKIHEWWHLDLSYTYQRRDVDSLNESAFSNIATLMLTYYPPKFSVGR